MDMVHENLESQVLSRELEDIRLESTSKYDQYEDKIKNEQSFSQLEEELEPTPEAAKADILLPKGDQMARGHEVAQSHDVNGNVLGKAYANPILDTRLYQVEFLGGKVTELTTNIIAESVYVQCDVEGNEYLPLNLLIDYQKDDKVIPLSDQQISLWGRAVTCKSTAAWSI